VLSTLEPTRRTEPRSPCSRSRWPLLSETETASEQVSAKAVQAPIVSDNPRRPDSGKITTPKLSEKRSQVTLHQLLRWNNFSDSRHGLPHACGPERPALRQ
jgi:hypothetical protein